jgi:PAS domain S-box-containing protein
MQISDQNQMVSEQIIDLLIDPSVDGYFFLKPKKPVSYFDVKTKRRSIEDILKKFFLVQANEAFYSLVGRKYKTVEGSTAFEIFSNTLQNNRKEWISLFKKGNKSFEMEFCKPLGLIIPCIIRVKCILDDKSLITALAGIIRKNTKHTKNPEGIDILSIALEQSANVVVITKPTGKIEYINKAFTITTGYQPEEVLGQNPRILKSGNQSPDFYKDLWMTITNGKKWYGEFQNMKKNGELYWENATITPVKNKHGRIIRFFAIKENITSRKLAEEALKVSEEKYRTLIANVPGIIYRCMFDKEWTMNYLSNAVEDLTGYKPEEYINNAVRSFASIIHPDDLERVSDTITIGVESFQQYSIEFRIITRINTIKWVSEIGRPVYNSSGEVVWLDGVISDITERVHVLEELKKAKLSAEEANKAKSEFLANISHEIRTPLNSVLGFTDLLEDTVKSQAEKQYLEAIKTSGRNLLTLINDLLDLSKIESGKLSLNYEYIELRKLLEEIKQIFSPRLTQKNLTYYEIIDPSFPAYIYSDESRLRQILINLVGNAVKFTHAGQVTTKVEFEEDKQLNTISLKISIMDTGIGIPKEDQTIIFESFRQQSRLDTRKYEGTGLGLSITKRLVEALNGAIFLDSDVNKGSNFMIVFPNVMILQKKADLAIQPEPAESEKKKDKILLQDFTGRFLMDYKDFMPMYDFIEFFSFYRNPRQLNKEIIAVFVVTGLDHNIINQKLHYFKKHDFLKTIPLVLLTETNYSQVHEEAQKIADLIISMPFELESFAKSINNLLRKNYKEFSEVNSVSSLKKVLIQSEIDSVINEFQNALYPQWESFVKKQPLKEIRNFANRINEIGSTFHIDFLLTYSLGLIDAIDDFNIEVLRERLVRFPNILNQLNNLSNDSV